MKLMRLTTNNQNYLDSFYVQRLQLSGEPYHVQYSALMDDCYGWADFWTIALGKLGYDVWEPVGNAEWMQKNWAKEHNISYTPTGWLLEIIRAQVQFFQPEIILVNDYVTYTEDFFSHLREECPSIRLIIGWCGAPYAPHSDGRVFRAYDTILSNIPSLVRHFQENGHRSEYMRHAFEPRILRKIDTYMPQNIMFSFLGSIVKIPGFHNTREKLLRQCLEQSCLHIWSDNVRIPSEELRQPRLRQILYTGHQYLKRLPGAKRLSNCFPGVNTYLERSRPQNIFSGEESSMTSRLHPGLFGSAMYQKLFESKLTLNTHIDISAQYASNMRLYEATGIGTCLLTEWQQDLHDAFEPEHEVITYRHADEAIEKASYLLAHERERIAVAQAGQRRTLRDHTFDRRAQQLDALIRRSQK